MQCSLHPPAPGAVHSPHRTRVRVCISTAPGRNNILKCPGNQAGSQWKEGWFMQSKPLLPERHVPRSSTVGKKSPLTHVHTSVHMHTYPQVHKDVLPQTPVCILTHMHTCARTGMYTLLRRGLDTEEERDRAGRLSGGHLFPLLKQQPLTFEPSLMPLNLFH